jgi:hypothetical protein
MTPRAGDRLVHDGGSWSNSRYTKVVLSKPAPLVQTNGMLNLGDGGFAVGANAFLGSCIGTEYNLHATQAGRLRT